MPKLTSDDTAYAPSGVEDMGQADFVLDKPVAKSGKSSASGSIIDPLSLPDNWTPHRPERPEKSEGGKLFRLNC